MDARFALTGAALRRNYGDAGGDPLDDYYPRPTGNIGEGLEVSRIAYTALVEGATGLTITRELTVDDVQDALAFARYEADELGQDLTRQELLLLAGAAEGLVDIGRGNVRRFADLIDRYEDSDALADDAAMDALGRRIEDIESIGADRLRDLGPLLLALNELNRGDVNRLADRFADADRFPARSVTRLSPLSRRLTPLMTTTCFLRWRSSQTSGSSA